jgi:RsiW-degrading membrane proteinase PrsW (M82 family)
MPSPLDWLLGALPALLWLAYFRSKDDHEPEPRRVVLTVYALGCVAALAVVALRPRLEPLLAGAGAWRGVVDAFLVTALVEETLKLGALRAAPSARRAWDEPLDGIVYGAAAALGFASVEGAFYLALSGQVSVLLARAFTATLVHVACTASVGFVIGWARLHRGTRGPGWALLALAGAVLAHGAYDLLLLELPGWEPAALLLLLPVLLAALGLASRWARARSPRYHPAPEQEREPSSRAA